MLETNYKNISEVFICHSYRFNAIPKNFNTNKKLIGLIRDPKKFYISLYFWTKKGHSAYIIPKKFKQQAQDICNSVNSDKENFKNFMNFIYKIDNGFTKNDHWWGKRIDYRDVYKYDIGPYTGIYTMMYLNNNYDYLINNRSYMDYLINCDNINDDIIRIFKNIGYNVDKFINDIPTFEKLNIQEYQSNSFIDEELSKIIERKERYIYQL